MRRTFWVSITLALAAFLVLPMPGQSTSLESRIQTVKGQIRQKRYREAVLTTTISHYSQRISGLAGRIRALRSREARLRSELARKRAELTTIRWRLDKARTRLAELRAELARARQVLAARLVAIYEDGEPDMITVILESDGFSDLLERTEFLRRISAQDHQIIERVRLLKDETERLAKQLAALEQRVKATVDAIAARRAAIAASKAKLERTRSQLASARSRRRSVLAHVHATRVHLEGDLSKMQAQVAAQLRAAQSAAPAGGGGSSGGGSGGGSVGPVQGSGRFIWPVNGPITSGFCERRAWESCHPGIDIGVPTGTPIHAADSGRVAIAGWESGYGNYTCIQHTASLSSCYGHQERIYVHVGQYVRQGQVIGITDCTGLCFGPHLHFEARVNGTPVNPLNYL